MLKITTRPGLFSWSGNVCPCLHPDLAMTVSGMILYGKISP
jgi:hypothetical protein